MRYIIHSPHILHKESTVLPCTGALTSFRIYDALVFWDCGRREACNLICTHHLQLRRNLIEVDSNSNILRRNETEQATVTHKKVSTTSEQVKEKNSDKDIWKIMAWGKRTVPVFMSWCQKENQKKSWKESDLPEKIRKPETEKREMLFTIHCEWRRCLFLCRWFPWGEK
jgi:hypothetical protein